MIGLVDRLFRAGVDLAHDRQIHGKLVQARSGEFRYEHVRVHNYGAMVLVRGDDPILTHNGAGHDIRALAHDDVVHGRLTLAYKVL